MSKINIFSILNRALNKLDLRMNESEATSFYEKYIAFMNITFAKNGSAILQNKPELKE